MPWCVIWFRQAQLNQRQPSLRQRAAWGCFASKNPAVYKSDSLGDEVVVVLRAGIQDGRRNTFGVLGDGGQQVLAAVRGGAWGAIEDLQGKAEGQDAQGHFLTRGPVGAEIGRIGSPKRFLPAARRWQRIYHPAEGHTHAQGGRPSQKRAGSQMNLISSPEPGLSLVCVQWMRGGGGVRSMGEVSCAPKR